MRTRRNLLSIILEKYSVAVPPTIISKYLHLINDDDVDDVDDVDVGVVRSSGPLALCSPTSNQNLR